MATRKALAADLQRLYRSPLEAFTAERNALAARLKKEGRKDDAAEVRALPKPTPSAWTVNALFDRQPKKMEALLGAGRQARAAQREAVAGRGAEALRESLRAARALADELRGEAGRLLAEQGRTASRDMVERIAANLQALAFSPAAAGEAERGWLDRDLEPPGFEVLAGLQVAGAPVPVPPLPESSAREAKREEESRRRRETIDDARREREAKTWRRRIAAAEETVERARAEADSLREEARQAAKDAAAARRQAETAERMAGLARERAAKAAGRLADAREALRAARERAEAAS